MWWFIPGCFVGVVVGYFTAAMMAIAKSDDKEGNKK